MISQESFARLLKSKIIKSIANLCRFNLWNYQKWFLFILEYNLNLFALIMVTMKSKLSKWLSLFLVLICSFFQPASVSTLLCGIYWRTIIVDLFFFVLLWFFDEATKDGKVPDLFKGWAWASLLPLAGLCIHTSLSVCEGTRRVSVIDISLERMA